MPYHTAGGWIQAFNLALARKRHASSIRIQVCDEHPECILITADGQKHHVSWRETDPADIAASLLKAKP